MNRLRWLPLIAVTLLAVACEDVVTPDASRRQMTPATATVAAPGTNQLAPMYAPVFVMTAGSAYGLNDAGDVIGRRYIDNGCGSFCLPPEENYATRNGVRITLPVIPGFAISSSTPLYLNNAGVIAGEAGVPGTSTRVARWVPAGAGYTVQDLGTFPGTSSADVQGLDDLGRIVGWATLGGAIPSIALPFMWSPTGGMVNLATQGYPNLRPAAMSRGGRVATAANTYQLGDPASIVAYPPLPAGFAGAGSNGTVVNDNGDVGHMLNAISGQSLRYPFRLNRGSNWQQLSTTGSGNLSRWGMGGINANRDLTFTVLSTGMFAEGPSGTAQSMSARVSPAYPGASVGSMGEFNASGDILASVSIGRSSRVVRLTPVGPCIANCIVVATFTMVGQFIQDPQNPGSCFQGGSMYNRTTATLRVTEESGFPLGGIMVNGRFLDDYWTNRQVSGLTDAAGNVTFVHQGLCGVGAIAFFVDGATAVGRTLDRTRGTLMGSVIPTVAPPPPPTNLLPVPRFRISCNSGTRACTFNGTNSSDDVAVTAWQWTFGDGTSGSGSTTSHTYTAGGTYPVTLTVFDSAGLSASLTKSVAFTAPPNQPPVAAWSASCLPAPAHTCTFNGSASSDPDGSIVSYTWTNAGGSTVSTAATFTKSFQRSATIALTLTVTDNGGRTASLTKNVTIP